MRDTFTKQYVSGRPGRVGRLVKLLFELCVGHVFATSCTLYCLMGKQLARVRTVQNWVR